MTERSSGDIGETDRDLLAAMAFCWADMLLEVDENGYILFAAGAIESLLGCPPERLLGEALEQLVIAAERPLLRAYLHSSTGIKRLEELDLNLSVPSTLDIVPPVILPVSISGYLISDPIGRYFLALRHRAIRPRARHGIDRLILQQGVTGRTRLARKKPRASSDIAQTATSRFTSPENSTHNEPAPHHNTALIVLENLAAARSRAETDAANELSDMIRQRGRTAPEKTDNPARIIRPGMHEPMIELERRIVAYASALRADLGEGGHPASLSATSPPDETSDLPFHIEPDPALEITRLTNDNISRDALALSDLDDQAIAASFAEIENAIDDPVFEGPDYDVAHAVHHQTTIGNDGFTTNLTRAVAYALNRLHARRDDHDDVSPEKLSASLPGLIQETMKSVRAFRKIVQTGSFSVALQPIVSLSNEEIHHYEALARFTGTDDTLAVDQIIHFAEGTGLITEFDLAMCRKVLDYMSSPQCRSGVCIAINLSGHSLEQTDFDQALLNVLDEFALNPSLVFFEVTETSRITNLHLVNATLQKLRARGHMVCLDDFGAGAANFEYLSALDVDVIKFDGRAMQTALANPKGRAFLKATASLCRDLHIRTIAEMIHDMETFEVLRDLGIDFGQGYHFGHPEAVSFTPNNSPASGVRTDTGSPQAGERS
ncbi:sensor domain-containing phosphodiesterase [Thalassospira mesophila]|uniref:sensor domain-containing phosphodiesterase n=1 Tax=Thalassospira mesophila TaxID=1293891 RepID=UPI001FE8BBB7|nr:EAL domain-containing protein [Thalassospira mesophila]